MEPEILSSAGEATASRPDWPASVEHPAREDHSVEATTPTGTTHVPRVPPATAHAPAWPRPANGNGHGPVHDHGFANGHARPRNGVHAAWPLSRPTAGATFPSALPFETPRAEGAYLRFGKRAIDVVGAIALIVLSAPIVAVIAALIMLESRGSVFYRSTRIGRGGRPFTFYKLRSMVKDAESHRKSIAHMNEADGPVFKIARDPRIPRVGRFLRTTSLDEIPQFYNVLIGDMSLVGPRPPIPEEVAQYEPWQLRRLDVRPGITCLWQISGRSRIGFQEWMRLDLEYIKRQSFRLDVKILLRTIPAVLSREGAY